MKSLDCMKSLGCRTMDPLPQRTQIITAHQHRIQLLAGIAIDKFLQAYLPANMCVNRLGNIYFIINIAIIILRQRKQTVPYIHLQPFWKYQTTRNWQRNLHSGIQQKLWLKYFNSNYLFIRIVIPAADR